MRGRVLEVDGDSVSVGPLLPGPCFGCMRGGCGKLAPVRAEKARNMEILPGQFVETGLSGKALFIQALEAFLPPAAGFAGAYLVTAGCFPALGESSRIAAGLVFLAAAAAAFSAFRKHFPPPLPRITRILPEEPRAEE